MCAGTYYLPPSTRHLLLATTYIVVDLDGVVGGATAGLGRARDDLVRIGVRVRVRVGAKVRVGFWLEFGFGFGLGLGLGFGLGLG